MTEADSVHSTPRRFTPKIVGGIDTCRMIDRGNSQPMRKLRRTRMKRRRRSHHKRNRQRIAAHARRLRR
jgi:hypothetical protein